MKYNIQNLTGSEIHKLWSELPNERRNDLFDQLVEYAETKDLDLSEEEKKEISDGTWIEKTNDGFVIEVVE